MDTKTDQLIRFMLPKQRVRGCFIRGKHIKAEAIRIHGLHGEIATMFSQLLLGTILLLSINKGGVRQVLQVDSTAATPLPIQRMLAEVRAGCVRGFVRWHEHHSKKMDDQKDIAAWMGIPLLVSTVRDSGMGEPYVSTIESDATYLADHLLRFLTQSVQTRADIVLHDETAIMLEAMPGCSDAHWFEAIGALAKISHDDLIAADETILHHGFDTLGLQIVGRDAYRWHCGCQPKRMAESLQKMPKEQLADLVDDDGYIGVSCQYCCQEHKILI
ncbi:MAG: Hsp33 family molecular chaperone HslO [Mariprofundaceae bacterium]|nr:Hsp33 family molecular chaperone HslO [Mariprofundaceae bacterium]